MSQARRVGAVGEDADDLGGVVRVAWAASISAVMLEPRPEIRMATRFLRSQRQLAFEGHRLVGRASVMRPMMAARFALRR